MGNIGDDPREFEFEPLPERGVPEPASPAPEKPLEEPAAPAEPVKEPVHDRR